MGQCWVLAPGTALAAIGVCLCWQAAATGAGVTCPFRSVTLALLPFGNYLHYLSLPLLLLKGDQCVLNCKERLGHVPDKPEKQDRNTVLREAYCSYRVSDSVEELLRVGSGSPPGHSPLYPHVSMEYERFFWSVNKTRTETFFCPLIIHKMNIRSLKNPLTKILLLRQELNQLDQNMLLCACVCERMTPNNTWGLLTKQKQCVSVEPKPA